MKLLRRLLVSVLRHPIDHVLRGITRPSRFIGPGDWEASLGMSIDDPGDLPLSEEEIKKRLKEPCPFLIAKKKEWYHVLVYLPNKLNGEPLTINRLQEEWDDRKDFYLSNSRINTRDRFHSFAFNQEVSEGGWYLFFIGIVPHSQELSTDKQLELLPEDYRQPTPIEFVSFYYVFTDKINRNILQSNWARTRSNNGEYFVFSENSNSHEGNIRRLTLHGFEGINIKSNIGVLAVQKLK